MPICAARQMAKKMRREFPMPHVDFQIGSELRRIEVDSSRSLLDEAVSAGLPVNYSCRRGDCGQCVAALAAGEVNAVNPSQSLHSDQGIYLCNAAACSDLVVSLPHFPELANVRQFRSPAKIHALSFLSDDVVELTLRMPPAMNPRFLPGQFVRLTNKERVTRSYSLAAAPAEDKLLRVHVRRVNHGAFSDYLFGTAKPGDLLHLDGPYGHFFLRDNDRASRTIFLATGTGIAPILAILEALSPEKRAALGDIALYWGNRHERDEYLRSRVKVLSSRIGLRYRAVHSREVLASPRHVQDLLTQDYDDLSDGLVLACGNPAMIEQARKVCLNLNLPADRFRSDPFTSS